MTCTYNGKSYSDGALICVNGREMKCRGGDWNETGYPCTTNTAIQQDQSSDGVQTLADGGTNISGGSASKSPD